METLSVATKGRLSNSAKKTLTLATLGLLLYVTPPIPSEAGADGRKSEKVFVKSKLERLKADDEEIISMIKMFMQCQ